MSTCFHVTVTGPDANTCRTLRYDIALALRGHVDRFAGHDGAVLAVLGSKAKVTKAVKAFECPEGYSTIVTTGEPLADLAAEDEAIRKARGVELCKAEDELAAAEEKAAEAKSKLEALSRRETT